MSAELNDAQLLRYARHILLDEFGIEGQQRLQESSVLVVGAGGLGSPVVYYLAAAGVQRIVVADHDTVDLSNLQRQILHRTADIDRTKVSSAKRAALQINPGIEVVALDERLDQARLNELAAQVSLVLDCSDNFATRHAVNRACVRARTPLVSGAAIRFSGQISVFDLREAGAPCYSCLFPEALPAEELRCATTGVLGPLVGIVGSVQACEALKLLVGMGEPLRARLLTLDALEMRWHQINFSRDPDCPVCAPRAPDQAKPPSA